MFFNNFRTALLTTAISSQLIFGQPSFGGGEYNAKAHLDLVDLVGQRLHQRKENAAKGEPHKSTKSLNGRINTNLQRIEKDLNIYEDPQTMEVKHHYMQTVRNFADSGDMQGALNSLLPSAQTGFLPAMYFTAVCHNRLDQLNDAVNWYKAVVLMGDNDAYNELKGLCETVNSDNLRSVYAAFSLSLLNTERGNGVEAAVYLERLVKSKQKHFNKSLVLGLLAQNKEQYPEALKYHRKVANGTNDHQYLATFLKNPKAYFACLKATPLTNEEILLGNREFIEACKKDSELCREFNKLAENCPFLSVAYVYAMYLLEIPEPSEKKKKKKSSGTSRIIGVQSICEFLSKVQGNDKGKAQDTLRALADQLTNKAEKEQAEKYLSKTEQAPKVVAVERKQAKPDNVDQVSSAYLRGLSHYALFKKDGGKDHLNQSLEALEEAYSKGNTEAGYTLAKVYYVKKKYEKARKLWLEDYKRGNTRSAYRLGVLSFEVDKHANNRDYYFSLALGQNYKSGKIYYTLGQQEEALNNINQACGNYYFGCRADHKPSIDRLTLFAEKSIPDALLNLGVYHFYQNQFDFARARFEQLKAIKDIGFDKLLSFNFGRLALIDGNFDQAEAEFKRALDLGFQEARLFLGDTYVKRGNSKLAREMWQHHLEKNPGDADALFRLGTLDISEGNVDNGIGTLIVANQLGSHDIVDYVRKLYAEQKTKEDQAGAETKVKKLSPQFASVCGAVLLTRGKIDEAVKYLEIACEACDEDEKSIAAHNLFQADLAQGNEGRALQYCRKQIENKQLDFVDVLLAKTEAYKQKPLLTEAERCSAVTAARVFVDLQKEIESLIDAKNQADKQKSPVLLVLELIGKGQAQKASRLWKESFKSDAKLVSSFIENANDMKDPVHCFNIGACLISTGHYAESLTFTEKAHESFSSKPELRNTLYNNLMRGYWGIGDVTKAVDYARKCSNDDLITLLKNKAQTKGDPLKESAILILAELNN